MDTVKFTRMDASTPEDWVILDHEFRVSLEGVADRILAHLALLRGNPRGFPVDRYEHSLQSATRAMHDGADEETVVCALLHDIGDVLSPRNHARVSATLLEPYVSSNNFWMVGHHDLFQGYFYRHLNGRDRNARDQYRDHPAFQQTVDFCDRWDQLSFDPDYDTMGIEAFEPMVRRIFSCDSGGAESS
jgi:predicted HD phosphohydrolase